MLSHFTHYFMFTHLNTLFSTWSISFLYPLLPRSLSCQPANYSFLPVHPCKLGGRRSKHLFIAFLLLLLSHQLLLLLLFIVVLICLSTFPPPVYTALHSALLLSAPLIFVVYQFSSCLFSFPSCCSAFHVSRTCVFLPSFLFHPLSFFFASPQFFLSYFFPSFSNFVVLLILYSSPIAAAGGAADADSKCRNQTPEVQAGLRCLWSLRAVG